MCPLHANHSPRFLKGMPILQMASALKLYYKQNYRDISNKNVESVKFIQKLTGYAVIVTLKKKRAIWPVELEKKPLGRGDISLFLESPTCEFWQILMGQLQKRTIALTKSLQHVLHKIQFQLINQFVYLFIYLCFLSLHPSNMEVSRPGSNLS